MSQNTTSLSFVAFERSIELDSGPSKNISELSAQTQMLDGLTEEAPRNVERLEGMRTPLHQRRCRQKITLAEARESELPEVDTAREGQQATSKRFHSSPQIKLEGPSEYRCAWGIDGGLHLALFGNTIINGPHFVNGHGQVLEKRE